MFFTSEACTHASIKGYNKTFWSTSSGCLVHICNKVIREFKFRLIVNIHYMKKKSWAWLEVYIPVQYTVEWEVQFADSLWCNKYYTIVHLSELKPFIHF